MMFAAPASQEQCKMQNPLLNKLWLVALILSGNPAAAISGFSLLGIYGVGSF
jgi:hypothetical protein